MTIHPAAGKVDVDFSLAMHNRTGKYFIGRDLLDCAPDLIDRVFYWMIPAQDPPSGLIGKVICKLQGGQVRANAGAGLLGWRPRRGSPGPLLHLEPYTVLTRRLTRRDAVLVHDVGPLTHPELFETGLYPAYRMIFAEIAAAGPHVIFASRTSQIEFERLFPNAALASSRVIYPAIRDDIAPPAPQPVARVGSARFLLTVGSIGDRKNQARCIRAFERSGLAKRGVRYVLCGSTEPGAEAVSALAARTPGVILLPYVSDAELAWLYDHAAGFVLASLLEGFGIPLAEAISHGVVPAVTRDSVLEEVAGPGALLVQPLDEDDLAAAMVRLVEMDDAERASRLTLLRDSIGRFSLGIFAQEWREALADIASTRPVSTAIAAQDRHAVTA
ncbi:MAG: glycosyltransferase family 1 protein [Novosphingobium sp.]